MTSNSNLLVKAREPGINPSASLERALTGGLRQHRAQWLAENRAAIDAYKEAVASQGVFSEGLCGF